MLKIGALGAGMISQSGLDGFALSGQAEVIAVYDRNQAHARDYAVRNGVKLWTTELRTILANSSIDAVYIALPNALHAPVAIAALEAGKHVLLEKPFALNTEEALRVVQTARRCRRTVQVGMDLRFLEGAQRVRALVAAGGLGHIYSVKAYALRRAGIPKLGTWFGQKALSGGGCLADIGVHMLDLALFTLGDFSIEAVSGHVESHFGPRGLGEGSWGASTAQEGAFDVEDHATAYLRLRSGAVVHLETCWAGYRRQAEESDVELLGTGGAASLFPAGTRGKPFLDLAAPLAFPHQNKFVHFVRTVRGEEASLVTDDQALAVQRALDTIYQSAKERREVRLEDSIACG